MDCDCPDCSDGLSCDGCDWPSKKKKAQAAPPPEHREYKEWPGPDELNVQRRIIRALALPSLPDGPPVVRRSPARWAGVVAIRFYQRFISPRLPTRCRYTPSCSQYGLEAVRAYGLVLGMRIALGRIQRCTRTVRRGTVDMLPVVASRG